jgi:hypothetical protein
VVTRLLNRDITSEELCYNKEEIAASSFCSYISICLSYYAVIAPAKFPIGSAIKSPPFSQNDKKGRD